MLERRLKYTIQDMIDLAQSRGFIFLSDHYKGIATKHLWKCSQGHIWETTPNAIKNGSGCKKCSDTKLRTSIKDAHQIAKTSGFQFISGTYLGMNKKHKWMCKEGHSWEAVTSNIKYGNGCPRCNMFRKSISEEKCRFIFEQLTDKLFPSSRRQLRGKLELDGYCKELNMAFEYQGQQHYNSQHYFAKINKSARTQQDIDAEKELICLKKGIRLILVPHNLDVSKVTKCVQEHLQNLNIDTKTDINWDEFKSRSSLLEKVKAQLVQRGILLVSKAYMGSHHKHDFVCVKCNYTWTAALKDVRDKSGCSQCSGNRKYTFEEIKKFLLSNNITLLSKKYISMNAKHPMQCNKCKHKWKATPSQIKSGRQCPSCRKRREV